MQWYSWHKPIQTLDFPHTLLAIWNPLSSFNSLMPHISETFPSQWNFPWPLIKLQPSRAYLTLLFHIRFSVSVIVWSFFIFMFADGLTLSEVHKDRVLSALSTVLFLNPGKLVDGNSHSIYQTYTSSSADPWVPGCSSRCPPHVIPITFPYFVFHSIRDHLGSHKN